MVKNKISSLNSSQFLEPPIFTETNAINEDNHTVDLKLKSNLTAATERLLTPSTVTHIFVQRSSWFPDF